MVAMRVRGGQTERQAKMGGEGTLIIVHWLVVGGQWLVIGGPWILVGVIVGPWLVWSLVIGNWAVVCGWWVALSAPWTLVCVVVGRWSLIGGHCLFVVGQWTLVGVVILEE